MSELSAEAHRQLLAEVAELREWRDRVALALGVADEVPGHGVHSARVDSAVERAEALVNIENEHDECPVWCDDCERIERPWSCTHCNGSGCGPGTALGAYSECEWCAGDGREHDPDEVPEHGRGCRCLECDPDHHRDGGHG